MTWHLTLVDNNDHILTSMIGMKLYPPHIEITFHQWIILDYSLYIIENTFLNTKRVDESDISLISLVLYVWGMESLQHMWSFIDWVAR